MLRIPLVFFALLTAAPACAVEPAGCDKFKWPLANERALLAEPSQAASGSEVPQPLGRAVVVTLVPFPDAKLPLAPSRAPKLTDSYAGFIRVPAPSTAGIYRITLSHGAWIDVVQGGHALRPRAFSGASGCDGVAKSVKFDLGAAPFVIELSGTPATSVALVVTPD